MQSDLRYKRRAEELAVAIKCLTPRLEDLAQPFRSDSKTGEDLQFDKWRADDWRRATFGDALVRLRQLTEQNFQYIEPIGVLAVARYIFELSIWLHLFEKDSRYGLLYYRQLLETQRRYYEDTANHLRGEVALLRRFAQIDDKATSGVMQSISEAKASEIGPMIRNAMDQVDAEASRSFSIYFEDAKTNGYGFQAHLVEQRALPPIEQAVADIAKEIETFQRIVPREVQELAKGRWEWRKMAREVQLEDEHDYIYSYASKLLHATPASLTTDQKNLELSEICIFLRYIYVKILEIMDLSRLQPEFNTSDEYED